MVIIGAVFADGWGDAFHRPVIIVRASMAFHAEIRIGTQLGKSALRIVFTLTFERKCAFFRPSNLPTAS